MIRSMTAFSRLEAKHHWNACDVTLVWEVKTVNHRYLEATPRLPDNFRAIESNVRQVIRQRLKRGKIDCTLHAAFSQENIAIHINKALAQQVLGAADTLRHLAPQLAPLNTIDLLNWPGVLEPANTPLVQTQEAAIALLAKAIDEVIFSRQREGEQLKKLILQRSCAIDQQLEKIEAQLPDILEKCRHTLHTRLANIEGALDAVRVEQEIVILAQKMDITEEIDRIRTHLIEVQATLNKDQPVGRHLDFLMQELHRETNTLSAKSINAGLTQSAIEIKVLIEQMREQIQNIE